MSTNKTKITKLGRPSKLQKLFPAFHFIMPKTRPVKMVEILMNSPKIVAACKGGESGDRAKQKQTVSVIYRNYIKTRPQLQNSKPKWSRN